MREFFQKRLSLAITLVIFVFFVFVATFIIALAITIFLNYIGYVKHSDMTKALPFFGFVGFCILLGTSLTAFLSKKALNPIRTVIDATHKVADGDFSVKVNIKGIGELEELSQSFNKMTYELSSIETLRSDFVNNFSHEFKTPIVSIRGFAKLLKENNLTEEERQEYLHIIMTESERLAALSTNVLALSKYEHLEIISDKMPFRLDEQIRKTIVLMEPKWSAKDITVNVELDNVTFSGNEDLTQQIWVNLIDNAIKFSHNGSAIHISLSNKTEQIEFAIQDEGIGMDSQTKARLFDKFYQGDISHAKQGNGLGLPLVKRIVQLCSGTIYVESAKDEGSKFTIILPK